MGALKTFSEGVWRRGAKNAQAGEETLMGI